jgi:hypothetical protein
VKNYLQDTPRERSRRPALVLIRPLHRPMLRPSSPKHPRLRLCPCNRRSIYGRQPRHRPTPSARCLHLHQGNSNPNHVRHVDFRQTKRRKYIQFHTAHSRFKTLDRFLLLHCYSSPRPAHFCSMSVVVSHSTHSSTCSCTSSSSSHPALLNFCYPSPLENHFDFAFVSRSCPVLCSLPCFASKRAWNYI